MSYLNNCWEIWETITRVEYNLEDNSKNNPLYNTQVWVLTESYR